MKLSVINNKNGLSFMVRIVHYNDQYGRDMKLNHTDQEPLVEFYDTRFKFDRLGDIILGQFVSRYHFGSLKNHVGGLDLLGYVDDWKLDSDAVKQLRALFQMWGMN